MAKNKDPAVLFYTSDFLSGCALMDMRERGQYITLLCLQRERGHMTMQEITRAVKKPSDEVMSKFRQDEEREKPSSRLRQDDEARRDTAHEEQALDQLTGPGLTDNQDTLIDDVGDQGNVQRVHNHMVIAGSQLNLTHKL